MEKIQSAIAKARATREGRLPEDAAAQAAPAAPAKTLTPAGATAAAGSGHGLAPGLPDPADGRVAPPSATPPTGIEAVWKAVPTFKVDQELMRRKRIVAFDGGQEASNFDVMRTRILQQMRANKWRRLAITSPSAGCGKTTTSVNLAFSLARQSDQRLLLAEVDLRRPALARMLGIKAHHSFAGVLEGKAPLADNIVRYGTNFVIATNHAPYRNPAELLHGPTVGPALAAIEAQFDPSVVIFDMPPLLVAAAESTTIEEVDTCERDLAAHTNVLGVILNKCHFPERRYGYSEYS